VPQREAPLPTSPVRKEFIENGFHNENPP